MANPSPGRCPKCGSSIVRMVSSSARRVRFHCASCGKNWYRLRPDYSSGATIPMPKEIPPDWSGT